MDPHIERFLKLDAPTLRSQYRAYVSLQDVDMKNQITSQNVIRSIIPYKVDLDHDQTIRYIRIENCGLDDDSVEMMINNLCVGEQ